MKKNLMNSKLILAIFAFIVIVAGIMVIKNANTSLFLIDQQQ